MSEIVHAVWSLAALRHHDAAALAAVEEEVVARLTVAAARAGQAVMAASAPQAKLQIRQAATG